MINESSFDGKLLLWSVSDLKQATGLGRTTIYAAIKSGTLPARKLGRRTVLLDAEVRQWLSTLARLGPTGSHGDAG